MVRAHRVNRATVPPFRNPDRLRGTKALVRLVRVLTAAGAGPAGGRGHGRPPPPRRARTEDQDVSPLLAAVRGGIEQAGKMQGMRART
jgi:hypothetical protein